MKSQQSQNLIVAAATAFALGWALPSWARSATVVGAYTGSQVSIRTLPTVNSATTAYTLVGNRVEVKDALRGNDGQIWYNLAWERNGSGWLRADYLALTGSDAVGSDGSNLPAILAGRQPGSTVNVRAYASTQAPVSYGALHGDRVMVLGSTQGKDGYLWHAIQFPSTTMQGWVRSDLVKVLY
jgi:uncharacterized protein YraI